MSETDGETIHFEYDNMGKIAAEQSARGTRYFQYDQLSRLSQEHSSTHLGLGGGSNLYRMHTYNQNGDLIHSSFPNTTKTQSYTYDDEGRITGKSERMDQLADQYTYNSQNQIIAVQDINHNLITHEYNSDGTVSASTDNRNNSTIYIYNGFGEPIEQHSPDTGVGFMQRNSNGELIQHTDARGIVTSFSYDQLGRVTAKTMTDNQTNGSQGFYNGNETIVYTYDMCTNGLGRLCALTDYSGTTSYTYDIWGQITKSKFQPANTTFEFNVGYQYNLNGDIVQTTYPSGKTSATPHQDGVTQHISFDSNTIIKNIKYSVDNLLRDWEWNNSVLFVTNVTRQFDTAGRMQSSFSQTHLRQYSYYEDNLNTTADQLFPDYGFALGFQSLHQYDTQNRAIGANVTSAVDNRYFSYEYDTNGNRTRSYGALSDGLTDYQYDPNSNRLLSYTKTDGNLSVVANHIYQYDANGNMITNRTAQYEYGVDNRMRRAIMPGRTMEFKYNALGQRTTKTRVNENFTEYFIYDQVGKILGVYDAQGNPKQEIVWMPNTWMPVAVVQGYTDAKTYYIESDNLGTPILAFDPEELGQWGTAKVVWSWDPKEPFGMQAPNEDVDGDGVYTTINLRFPGQWFDVETGLFHNGFRDYSPALGRYIQSDPLGLEAGWNTYAYVGSNPLVNFDPYGLDGWLTIYSNPGMIINNTSGHSWIEYRKNGGETTTFGTFGNKTPMGLYRNIEKGIDDPLTIGRTKYINDQQEKALFNYIHRIENMGWRGWSFINPCSSFAQKAWLITTGEDLTHRTKWGISNPLTLSQGIHISNIKTKD